MKEGTVIDPLIKSNCKVNITIDDTVMRWVIVEWSYYLIGDIFLNKVFALQLGNWIMEEVSWMEIQEEFLD